MTQTLENKSILLIISGGIAAYKSLELIRLIRKQKGHVRCILTRGGGQFITPLSVASLSEETVYTDLWSLKDETEMGHIRLTREADLVVVAPASANLIAQVANGLAEDLASTTLLASNKPILIAPAMNHKMWDNAATRENLAKLKSRGILQIGPTEGDMACGEFGMGRMAEPEQILESIKETLSHGEREGPGEAQRRREGEGTTNLDTFAKRLQYARKRKDLTINEVSRHLNLSGNNYGSYERGRTEMTLDSLAKVSRLFEVSIDWLIKGSPHPNPLPRERGLHGYKAIVTSGPTFEPIDPVRFIGNRSSGKQGHAIAEALAQAGATVTLISGPVSIKDPAGVKTIRVETASEMLNAVQSALPADIAVCAAAVSDWSAAETKEQKIKKRGDQSAPAIALKENPDILKTLATHKNRPQLVVGFAAETENLIANAKEKLARKGCDWLLANDVGSEKIFGADENHVYLITRSGSQEWPRSGKQEIARKLVRAITEHMNGTAEKQAAE